MSSQEYGETGSTGLKSAPALVLEEQACHIDFGTDLPALEWSAAQAKLYAFRYRRFHPAAPGEDHDDFKLLVVPPPSA
ncbi:MAG: hypothetical protein AB7U75_05975 [Hyphomicrobiaceae bacterium]